MSQPKKTKQIKVGALCYAQLIKYLIEGEHSCQQLADLTGLHVLTVYHYTRELHAAKVAHISGWEKDTRGRDAIKIYKLGPGKDAKRAKTPAAQRQAQSRAKKQAAQMLQVQAGRAQFIPAGNGRLRYEPLTASAYRSQALPAA